MYEVSEEMIVILIIIWWLQIRERLAVSKQATKRFDGERFNLRKLIELVVRKQYQTEITNRFAALENLSDDEDINKAWRTLK